MKTINVGDKIRTIYNKIETVIEIRGTTLVTNNGYVHVSNVIEIVGKN